MDSKEELLDLIPELIETLSKMKENMEITTNTITKLTERVVEDAERIDVLYDHLSSVVKSTTDLAKNVDKLLKE